MGKQKINTRKSNNVDRPLYINRTNWPRPPRKCRTVCAVMFSSTRLVWKAEGAIGAHRFAQTRVQCLAAFPWLLTIEVLRFSSQSIRGPASTLFIYVWLTWSALSISKTFSTLVRKRTLLTGLCCSVVDAFFNLFSLPNVCEFDIISWYIDG